MTRDEINALEIALLVCNGRAKMSDLRRSLRKIGMWPPSVGHKKANKMRKDILLNGPKETTNR